MLFCIGGGADIGMEHSHDAVNTPSIWYAILSHPPLQIPYNFEVRYLQINFVEQCLLASPMLMYCTICDKWRYLLHQQLRVQ